MVGDAHTNAPVYSKVPDGITQFQASDGSRIIQEWSSNEADNRVIKERETERASSFHHVQLIP